MIKSRFQSIQLTYSAGVITVLLLSGLAGCSMYAYPNATPQNISSTSGKDTMPIDKQAVLPDDPYTSGE
jgi:hypothetical protein